MSAVVGLSASPILQFFDNNGRPNVGGTLLTQVGGVNYPTYQDAAGATALPNPIPLNSRGEVSNSSGVSCQLFLVDGVAYTFTLYDALGNQLNKATSVEAFGAGVAVSYVTNIAGLKALSGMAAGAIVQTQGYYASGDGGAGTYWWNSTDTRADNGGTVLAPNAGGTGRWNLLEHGRIKAKQFGAVGDGVADDHAALQAWINWLISAQVPGTLDVGVYSTSLPLLALSASGTAYFGLDICGQKMAYQSEGTTFHFPRIVPTFVNTFALGIQGARGVRIKDVMLEGKNDYSASAGTSSYLMTNSNFVINSCRDSRYSPYAGIVIDPFGTSVPADGGYPGFSSYYGASVNFSSGIEFDNVIAQGFVAGFIVSPNGTSANGSEINFRNCSALYNKTGLSICQSQSRNVYWYAGNVVGALYCFDGQTYGAQGGFAPDIFGVGCNSAKYLFNCPPYNGSNVIYGLYAEGFASIGFFGVNPNTSISPVLFSGCHFEFSDMTGFYTDHHLVAYAPVRFEACLFYQESGSYRVPVLRFYLPYDLPMEFDNCYWFGLGDKLYLEWGFAPSHGAAVNAAHLVAFDNCAIGDGSARGPVDGLIPISRRISSYSAVPFDRSIVVPGEFMHWDNDAAGLFRFVGGGQNQVSLGNIAITLGSNGTATFTAPDATILEKGDLIYSATATNFEKADGTVTFSSSWECIGQITGLVGSTVTIAGVPQNLGAGTLALYLVWWSRLHQACTGTTNSNTSLTSVSPIGTFAVGNRIKGTGIPAGAYVTANDGVSTLTISKAATSSSAGVRLYDADVYSLSGTAV